MISIVCVYNDQKMLNDYLLKSLRVQTVKFESIKIDNTRNTFKSAAEALNYGGNKAKGKYIIFVHQDVDLSSNSWLENAERILESIPGLGIAGVAGMSERKYNYYKERMRNIIRHGDTWWGNKIQKPEKVQTLDECLIIIPKSVFDVLKFDEKVCDDWHLYATDYCLSIRKLGFYAYVMPMFIYHRSTGDAMSPAYYRTLKKILKKYKSDVKRIYKPGKAWFTSYPLVLQRMILSAKELLRCLLIMVGIRYLWRKSGLKSLGRKLQI